MVKYNYLKIAYLLHITAYLQHYIYVNTKVDDGSDIAELMQYFKHSKGFHPKFKKLSERVNYLKETNEGVNEMCDIVEEYADKKANAKVAEQARSAAMFLLKEGVDPKIVAQAHKLPLETVLQIQKEVDLQNA